MLYFISQYIHLVYNYLTLNLLLGNQQPSHQSPQADDPKELKRQGERERYASLSA
jgi:hypothetical protein